MVLPVLIVLPSCPTVPVGPVVLCRWEPERSAFDHGSAPVVQVSVGCGCEEELVVCTASVLPTMYATIPSLTSAAMPSKGPPTKNFGTCCGATCWEGETLVALELLLTCNLLGHRALKWSSELQIEHFITSPSGPVGFLRLSFAVLRLWSAAGTGPRFLT